MDAFAFRLEPGADLRKSINAGCRERDVAAGVILTCVGSLRTAVLRFADQRHSDRVEGPFEILALSGTLSGDGGCHLHIALGDAHGATVGGHLMDGSIVHTTAEVVVCALSGLAFSREQDPQTGYRELKIAQRKP